MKTSFFALLTLIFVVSCGTSTKENSFESQVKTFVENKQFTEALNLLQSVPSTEETTKMLMDVRVANGAYLLANIEEAKKGDLTNPEQTLALAKAHLAYGIFLEYYGEHLAMRDRMTGSLAHFRRTLQLDPSNEKAVAEIAQIESIYSQMGRPIPQEIAE